MRGSGWIAEAAGILGDRLLRQGLGTPDQRRRRLAEEPLGVAPDHRLGQPARLDQEEPVVVGGREGLVGAVEERQRRHDVENGGPLDARPDGRGPCGGHPPAAVVARDREALEAPEGA